MSSQQGTGQALPRVVQIGFNKCGTRSLQQLFEGIRHFRKILHDYPGTILILILNLRDREDWIRSRLKHGQGELVQRVMRQRGVATPEEVAEQWRQEWDKHVADVRGYMADFPDQMIEFNLDTDDVKSLIDRLSAYGLKASDWGDVGRTRGVRENALIKRLKVWWAHVRPRPET